MTTTLRLGDTQLPEQAITETFAILGKRGSGKTTTARVLAEELLAKSLPVVVLDPTGVWWGLRTSADGTGDGYPAVIFGGDHADVPLEPGAGELIANVIVEQHLSAVLDLSLLSKTAARTFAATFLERLYLRNREPLMVIVDEADLFAPQRLAHGHERLLGAMDDLVRRGRVRGLGTVLITQRPQVLNKDVLSQAEALIALRMVGKRDIDAIDDWVRVHADEDEARQVKADLPTLPIGHAWLWSPGWLGILERVQVQQPSTFDSSATPRAGEARPQVRKMAPVDLAALGERITATVERAKADDPRALRAHITRLERELEQARAETPEPEIVEVPAISEEALAELRAIGDQAREALAPYVTAIETFATQVTQAVPQAAQPRPKARPKTSQPPPAPAPAEPRDESLPKAQRAILAALAQHGGRTTTQVALLTGYSHKSGGYRNALSSLRSAGYIEGRGDLTITDAGIQALGPFDPLPTGPALRDWWKQHHLGKAERAVLDVLTDAWPNPVSVDEIAQATGYSPTSGGFRNALSRLRSLELAAGRGELVISDQLMERTLKVVNDQ